MLLIGIIIVAAIIFVVFACLVESGREDERERRKYEHWKQQKPPYSP